MNPIPLILIAGTMPSLVCTLFLIGHRVRPHPSWTLPLKKAWLFVLVLAGTALLHLGARYLLVDARDTGARLETYMAAVTFTPCIVSGLVALFLKP
ncbi:hypothetical protein [Variovorax boronicumulans]|uniref:hypothetical protein n=1 Tax=Variovorax boronicumulans TaxID=436515 RepID=UPI0012E43A8D|nr:hypothetical protein [Variovorax boronicumulans]GER14305.1 hypothetical protein VHAB30_54980 [Variovorax boronicumulans]